MLLEMGRVKNFAYAGGLALMALGFAIGPIFFQRSQANLTTKKDGLTGSQIMRGAFSNTGEICALLGLHCRASW